MAATEMVLDSLDCTLSGFAKVGEHLAEVGHRAGNIVQLQSTTRVP